MRIFSFASLRQPGIFRTAGSFLLCLSPKAFTCISVRYGRFFSLKISTHKLCERQLAFPAHDTANIRLTRQHFFRIIGHLRTAKPDLRLRQHFLYVPDDLHDIGNVPYIAGKADKIRLSPVDIL